jgi:hypothetical protein
MISEKSQSTCKNTTDFKNQWLLKWWAHQDLNLGPKDYEQLQEIKPIKNQ